MSGPHRSGWLSGEGLVDAAGRLRCDAHDWLSPRSSRDVFSVVGEKTAVSQPIDDARFAVECNAGSARFASHIGRSPAQ